MRLATYAFVRASVRSRPMAMMCGALLAARSPPRLRRWGSSCPTRHGAHAAERREGGLRPQRLRIVAGREQELCGARTPDRMTRDEVRREFVDDGPDHRVEIGDLVVQFQRAAGSGCEADPVSGFDIAIARQVWPPASARAACGSCGAASPADHLARRRWWSGSSARRCVAPPRRSSDTCSIRARIRSSRPGFWVSRCACPRRPRARRSGRQGRHFGHAGGDHACRAL